MSEQSDFCQTHCEEHYMTKASGIKVLWILAGLALTYLGSSVGWAFATSNAVTKVTTIVERHDAELKDATDTYKSIEKKLDLILKSSTK